jgi:hypothetical protein
MYQQSGSGVNQPGVTRGEVVRGQLAIDDGGALMLTSEADQPFAHALRLKDFNGLPRNEI